MATERLRYVRQDSSAGGNGTEDRTTGTNRAYSSIKECIDSEAANLVTADVYLKIHVTQGTLDNDSASTLSITGYTTDATRFIWIYVDPSIRHGGLIDAGYQIVQQTAWVQICRVLEEYVRIEGLGVESNGSQDGELIEWNVTGTGELRVSHCVLDSNGGYVYEDCLGVTACGSSSVLKVWNCLIVAGAAAAIGIGDSDCTAYIENVTAIDCAAGTAWWEAYAIFSGAMVCYNCIAQNPNTTLGTSTHYDSSVTGGYNVDADSSAPATGRQTGTVSFVNSASDWHLSTSDTVAKGNGTDRSSGSIAFSDDIDEDARSVWDIGCDEVSTAAAGPKGALGMPFDGPVRRVVYAKDES